LISAVRKYSEDGLFLRAFMNTKAPQIRRTVSPKSITPKHRIGTYNEIKKIIDDTVDPIVILECV
jgi:hypothetical protein